MEVVSIMTELPQDPGTIESPTPDAPRSWNVTKSAAMNIGFFIASLLLTGVTGERARRWAIPVWVVCLALFLVSYSILAFQVLSLAVGRGLRVRGWIRAWTLLGGVLILLFAIGLLRFLFPS